MPASSITRAHRATSVAMRAPSSSGVLGSGSRPRSRKRRAISDPAGRCGRRIEQRDHVGRRLGRHEEAFQVTTSKSLAAASWTDELRADSGAAGGRGGERTQLLVLERGLERPIGLHDHIDVAADRRGEQITGRAVGNDHDVERQQRLEQRRHKVVGRSDRRRADVERAGSGACAGNHLGKGGVFRVSGTGRQHVGECADHRDRREVATGS